MSLLPAVGTVCSTFSTPHQFVPCRMPFFMTLTGQLCTPPPGTIHPLTVPSSVFALVQQKTRPTWLACSPGHTGGQSRVAGASQQLRPGSAHDGISGSIAGSADACCRVRRLGACGTQQAGSAGQPSGRAVCRIQLQPWHWLGVRCCNARRGVWWDWQETPPAALVQSHPDRFLSVQCDLTCQDSMDATGADVARLASSGGAVDSLVNIGGGGGWMH